MSGENTYIYCSECSTKYNILHHDVCPLCGHKETEED